MSDRIKLADELESMNRLDCSEPNGLRVDVSGVLTPAAQALRDADAEIEHLGTRNEKLLLENKRLREALEFYAECDSYWSPAVFKSCGCQHDKRGYLLTPVLQDEGAKAKAALAGGE